MTGRVQTPEYDYAGAFDLIDRGLPGVGGCMGCFRCRAGDHGSCHGCACSCGWRWHPDYYGTGFVSPCPEKCRCGGYCPDDGTHLRGCQP